MLDSIACTVALWSSIIAVPLFMNLSNPFFNGELTYKSIFPDVPNHLIESEWPSPIGLSLGILAVIIGQLFILIYFSIRVTHYSDQITPIQKEGAPSYKLKNEIILHLSQPEGFVLLGTYLISTWMFKWMPSSYYSFEGGINWTHVLLQLLCQDFFQYLMHYLEHKLSSSFYQSSHKPHHRFTNPKLFDAFNGSPTDTTCMILIPLIITARLIPANVWSYMTFGSLYANWLCLIHAEYKHPWDPLFRVIGFGTAADHHIHHKLFVYNYGHIFM
jgi:alternative squalene epoxidase